MILTPTELIDEIRKIVGEGSISLHEPSFIGNEKSYLIDCIKSTYVSSSGFYLDKLEAEISKYTGSKFVILVCNGTSALHLCLRALGVKANQEVIIPAITFVATANAIKYTGATPHFVDVENESLGIDPINLRDWLKKITTKNKENELINRITGKTISAILPVSIFGHPCKIKEILKVAEEFNLPVVEDSSEALGSFIGNDHIGTFGKLGVLSFNGNKIITAGGGGAILTNDETLASEIRHLSTTAKLPHKWDFIHDKVGYNYRMPNLNAALAFAQFQNLEKFISQKRDLFSRYSSTLEKYNNISLLKEPNGCRSNYWLQAIKLDNETSNFRDKFLGEAFKNKIYLRPVWKVLSNLKPFKNSPKSLLTNALKIEKSIINLPSSSFL